MNKKTLPIIETISAAICLGAINIWAPVCSGMLELASGEQTHMKCHYAACAGTALAIVMLTAAVLTLVSAHGRRKIQVVAAVASLMLVFTFTFLIGVCAKPGMACHATKAWVITCSLIAMAAAIADAIKSSAGTQIRE